ncbi:MAG: DUF4198 domain-containing protein [Peptococcaceae bacterium]|nr:DUF4198 domain-containing protein [Peptococcaceae bacterium]
MENNSPNVTKDYLVWLEPEHLHYHAGGAVQVRALWGRMMRREGEPGIKGWTCYALDPSGNELEADVGRGEGNYRHVAFFAVREGIYNLVLEIDNGVYSLLPSGRWVEGPLSSHPGAVKGARYFQRARIAVPVGHHIHGSLAGVKVPGLDIFSGELREYRLGDSIAVKVFFNGRPLPGAEVKATCHLYTGTEYPWQGKTGQDGTINFTFDQKGHWMFTCRYTDCEGRQEGRCDETVYTATFVVAGVR